MTESGKPLKVAVLGCGSVGSQVVRLLQEQAADLAARVGAPVELVGVAVRRLDAAREVEVPEGLLTTDAEGLVARGDVDVVVEVIGGIEPARSPDPLGARARRLGGHAPTRRCSPRTARPSSRRPRRPGATSTTRPPSPERSRSCARCASRWPATRSPGCWASSTAPPTSSSTRWTPPAPASPTRSRRPRSWATPRPTRPPTSRASTPRPRPRSWPRWPSTPGSPPPTSTARASPRSAPPTSPPPARWAAWSSCWPSASCASSRTARRPSRCACTRR